MAPTSLALLALLALLAPALLPGPVRAATVRALALAELTSAAELIVVAQARERQSRWDGPGRLIVTDVALTVEQVVKGTAQPGQDLIVTHLGGQVDGLGLSVPGEAAFELGGRALLFLQANSATGELRAVGMSQGVLPVTLREGVATVAPGGAGAALMAPDEQGVLRAAPAALTEPVALADFIARIERLLRTTR